MTKENGMDVQVGVGEEAVCFRIYPVVTHFITDNMQAIELRSVNKENCLMCVLMKGKNSHYCIGFEKCRHRDLFQHKDVCTNYSKYEKIGIKNIAAGRSTEY